MKPFLISLACVLAAIAVLSLRTRYRLRREAVRRWRPSKAEFIADVTSRGVSIEVGQAVYAGFQKWASPIVRDFPLAPTDRIALFIPIVVHDYEAIMDGIVTASGRSRSSDNRLPFTRDTTIADIAIWVEKLGVGASTQRST